MLKQDRGISIPSTEMLEIRNLRQQPNKKEEKGKKMKITLSRIDPSVINGSVLLRLAGR